MSYFKLYGRCEVHGTPHKAFFVRKRTVQLPIGNLTATSKILMCSKHYKAIRDALKQQQNGG